jgi:uncharacterized protein YhaN
VKIISWRVDGYGVFAGTQVSEVGPGLTIVHGRNESGKTTLMDFVCGVLFGYPDRRRRLNQHEPLSGGRHGGSIELVGEDGTRLRVERHVGAREPVVTSAGEPRTAAELRRLLGGADEGLFRSTFAFGLDELRSLETLEQDEVRELIYSAGVLGAGQRATSSLRALDERRSHIVRARQADARANHLLRELESIEEVLREARSRARHFPAMQAELDQSADAVAGSATQLDALDRRSRELDRLLAAWPVWNRRQLAQAELDTIPDGDENILALAPEVAEVTAELARAQAREEQRAGLDRSRASLRDSVEWELAQLGRGWDVERARATNCSIGALSAIRAHLSALEEVATAARSQADRVQLARETHAGAAASEVLSLPSRASTAVERDRARLRAYRSLLAEEARLSAGEVLTRDITRGRRATHARRAETARSRLVLGACVVMLLLAAVAALAALRRNPLLTIAATAALAIVALAITTYAAAGRSTAPGSVSAPISSGNVELAGVRERLSALAEELGLDTPTVTSDLEALDERLSVERDTRSGRDAATAELERASRRLETELAAADGRADASAAAEATWTAWKETAGLDDVGSPAEALDVLELVTSLKSHLDAVVRVQADLARHESTAADLGTRAARLAARCPDIGAASSLLATVELLGRRVEEAAARRERARSLAGTISEADCQLAEMLGPSSCDSLAAGDVVEWQEQLAAVQGERATVASCHEAAVRRHQDQSRQLDAIAGSDHIARLDVEQTRIQAELRSELGEWWVLSLARALVAATLESYERDRQPAVVRRAAELFSEVTSGRYVRLVPRTSGPGGKARSMDAVEANGRAVDIGFLSRGTVEQLYLCLRIALAEEFAEQSVALPFLMDDVLVNLDPERAQAMAGVLARISARHQVLFFTCHPHVVEMLARHASGARLVELASRSSQGSPLLAAPREPRQPRQPLRRSRPVA